jgi:glycine/serine hydroxymethyltransferase
MSPLASQPLRQDFYNRYFFNDDLNDQSWFFPGGRGVADVEARTGVAALTRLGAAKHVNLRPVSGMTAMLMVLLGLGGAGGSTVVSIDPATGGHYATAALVERLGRQSRVVPQQRGCVDLNLLRKELTGGPVALVYLDLQNCLHRLDVDAVVSTVREHSPTTRVHVDCSHTLGLILGGAHPNPLDAGADSMGGSTHKSFPGPHKGVLFTRSDDGARLLKEAQFHLISSHHFAETLALSLAAAEFEIFGREYARNVVPNAVALAQALQEHGFRLLTEGPELTQTHQVWATVGTPEETMDFAEGLAEAGVLVNVIPDLPGADGHALRLGINEITFDGGSVESMRGLADVFSAVRDGRRHEARRLHDAVRDGLGRPHYLTELD